MDIEVECPPNTTPVVEGNWNKTCPQCGWSGRFRYIYSDDSSLMTFLWVVCVPLTLLVPFAFLFPIIFKLGIMATPKGYECPSCTHRIAIIRIPGPF